MTIEEFYEQIGGDYSEITSRILQEDRIRKYLYIFLNDKTFTNLCTEIDSNNVQRAFVYALTLKGFSQSLSLSSLYVYANLIAKALHNNNLERATCFLPDLSREYTRIITEKKALKKAEGSRL